MVPFSTKRIIKNLWEGKTPVQIQQSGNTPVTTSYLLATYLEDAFSARELAVTLLEKPVAGAKAEPEATYIVQCLLLQPNRGLPRMLLQATSEKANYSPIELELPESVSSLSKETLLAELNKRFGKEECKIALIDVSSIAPLLLAERTTEVRRRTSTKKIVSLAVSLKPSLGGNLEGLAQGAATLNWVTCAQFEARINKDKTCLSDHLRILAGLIWDKNYPLTMEPPFEDLSNGSNENKAAAG
jgi:hypothetical protein